MDADHKLRTAPMGVPSAHRSRVGRYRKYTSDRERNLLDALRHDYCSVSRWMGFEFNGTQIADMIFT